MQFLVTIGWWILWAIGLLIVGVALYGARLRRLKVAADYVEERKREWAERQRPPPADQAR